MNDTRVLAKSKGATTTVIKIPVIVLAVKRRLCPSSKPFDMHECLISSYLNHTENRENLQLQD